MNESAQKERAELQQLLEENPNLEPTALLDGSKIVTLTITDGVPQLVESPVPATFNYDIPDISEVHGTPLYRIYRILRNLKMVSPDCQPAAEAAIQSQVGVPPVASEIRIEPPTLPPSPEIVQSIVSENTDLRSKADTHGMYRNLEVLQQRIRAFQEKAPELEPLIIRTASGNYRVGIKAGRMIFEATTQAGRPYVELNNCPQVQLFTMLRSLQGLEKRLYGDVTEVRVTAPTVKLSAGDNLARVLADADCGNLLVFIRSRKADLYLSGLEKFIIYRGRRISVEGGALRDEATEETPTGFTKVEYGALPQAAIAVLTAFWAYISPKPQA